MNVTNTKNRGCGDKRGHEYRERAVDQMFALVRAGAALCRLNVYRCKHCSRFHVGHKPKPRHTR